MISQRPVLIDHPGEIYNKIQLKQVGFIMSTYEILYGRIRWSEEMFRIVVFVIIKVNGKQVR